VSDGNATEATLGVLIKASGIGADAFKEAALMVLANADAYGVDETAADNLKRELNKLEQGASSLSLEFGEAEDIAGDFEEELEEVEFGAEATKVEIVNLADELRKMADPVFKAESATDKFSTTLARVQEDAIITQDELEELTKDYGDMQAATDAVTADNIDAYEQQATEALALVDEATVVTRGEFSSLSSHAVKELGRTRENMALLLDKKLQVRVRMTAPSRLTIEKMVMAAVITLRKQGRWIN
jgi:chromosome segregation ATPase